MKTTIKEIIEQKTKKLVEKGEAISNINLYNLCVLNKLSTAVEEENNKKLSSE